MKKITILTMVLLLGGVGGVVLLWLSPSPQHEVAQYTPVVESMNMQAQMNEPQQVFSLDQVKQRLKDSRLRRKGLSLDEDQFKFNLMRTQLFEASDAQTMKAHNPKLMAEAQLNDGRVFIKNDPYILESKAVGDKISFMVASYGLKHNGTIQRIQVDPNEDIVTWSGVLEGGDPNQDQFHLSQSMKDQFTAGTVTTNGKTYSILVKNGYGWFKDVDQEAVALLNAETQEGT